MYLGIHIRTVDKSNQVFTLTLPSGVCLSAGFESLSHGSQKSPQQFAGLHH